MLLLLAGASRLLRNESARRVLLTGGFGLALAWPVLVRVGILGRPPGEMPAREPLAFLLALLIPGVWLFESLFRPRAVHPRHLALAGTAALFLFALDGPSVAEAWLLADLILALSADRGSSDPVGFLAASGVGILAWLGAFATPRPVAGALTALAVSVRARIIPWPGVPATSFGDAAFGPLLGLVLLRRGVPPQGLLRWPLYLWLVGGLVLYALDAFLGTEMYSAPVSRLAGRAWWWLSSRFKRAVVEAGEGWEGEALWVWAALAVILLVFGLHSGAVSRRPSLLWGELFPTGLGLMGSSFFLLVASERGTLLFGLLAQYLMAALYPLDFSESLPLLLARVLLGVWICLLLYLSRWGARWLNPHEKIFARGKNYWPLRLAAGVAGGILAYKATGWWDIPALTLEEEFVVTWMAVLGVLNAAFPGSVLRRTTGALTVLTAVELVNAWGRGNLRISLILGLVQLAVAFAGAFLAAYEGAAKEEQGR